MGSLFMFNGLKLLSFKVHIFPAPISALPISIILVLRLVEPVLKGQGNLPLPPLKFAIGSNIFCSGIRYTFSAIENVPYVQR